MDPSCFWLRSFETTRPVSGSVGSESEEGRSRMRKAGAMGEVRSPRWPNGAVTGMTSAPSAAAAAARPERLLPQLKHISKGRKRKQTQWPGKITRDCLFEISRPGQSIWSNVTRCYRVSGHCLTRVTQDLA